MREKLNVIIDARMVDENLHGIARYTYELIKNNEGNINYNLLVNNVELSEKIFENIDNINFIKMKSKFLSLGEQFELPKIVNNFNGDVIFHSPSFVGSPFIKKKMIMTIHDLNHIRFPQFYTPFHKYYYKFIVKNSAKKSKKILTVSKFAKDELLEWLGCSDEKITVTYNGIDKSFRKEFNNEKIHEVIEKYKLPKEFLLYIGNQKPHKNVITLIKALSLIEDEEIPLVINGKLSDECLKKAQELGVEKRIKSIGFVDDKDLPCIYSLAKIFVFPSLYEGFGLPPLEAMACECPVIVSNAASLPEVVEDGAIRFETLSEKELSKKIDSIINKSIDLNILIEKGLEVTRNYKWKECSDKTLEVYRSI